MIHAGTISIGSACTAGVCWRVLDQLDQLVAQHDLAGRDRDLFADTEVLDAGRRPAFGLAVRIVEPGLEAARQVRAGFRGGDGEQLGIGVQVVRGGGRVEHLAQREFQTLRRVGRQVPGLAQRFTRPCGELRVRVRQHIEGPLVPGRIGELRVAPGGRRRLAAGGLERKAPEIHQALRAAVGELRLLVRDRPRAYSTSC